jgi:glutamate-1-semialdehyde aminotransferase
MAYSPRDLLTEDLGIAARLSVLLQEEGVLMAGGARFNLCSAMTDADVDETIMRFERALVRLPRRD